jgi:hypothetical protein
LALLHPHSHDSQLVLRGAGTVKIETDCGICSNRLRKVESNAEFGGGCSEVDPKYLGLDRKFSSPNKFSQEFKMKNYFSKSFQSLAIIFSKQSIAKPPVL